MRVREGRSSRRRRGRQVANRRRWERAKRPRRRGGRRVGSHGLRGWPRRELAGTVTAARVAAAAKKRRRLCRRIVETPDSPVGGRLVIGAASAAGNGSPGASRCGAREVWRPAQAEGERSGRLGQVALVLHLIRRPREVGGFWVTASGRASELVVGEGGACCPLPVACGGRGRGVIWICVSEWYTGPLSVAGGLRRKTPMRRSPSGQLRSQAVGWRAMRVGPVHSAPRGGSRARVQS